MIIAAPLASHIPLACLAGVLFVVCWNMAEIRHWPHILKAKRSDAFLLPIAFLLTVFVNLPTAVVIGTLLAMLFFVKRMADTTSAERLEPSESGVHRPIPANVEVYEVRGPFFFGAASMIRDILGRVSRNPKVLVLHIPDVPFIDATATFAIRDLLQSCRKRGIELMMSGVGERPFAILSSTGLADEIGNNRIFSELAPALEASKAMVAA
jgi:sulfate permease, SulP family